MQLPSKPYGMHTTEMSQLAFEIGPRFTTKDNVLLKEPAEKVLTPYSIT
jgi:hypothetical protein